LNRNIQKIVDAIKNHYRISFIYEQANTGQKLSSDIFSFALRSHFDFILYIGDTYEPIAAIEYDGWHHRNDSKMENDKKKNLLCERADFTLIRIPSTDKLSEQYLLDTLSPYLDNGEMN
jgi:hypothetical protein